MPYCGDRNCDHCFPRDAPKIDVLEDAVYDVRSLSRDVESFFYDGHPDADEPWFAALVEARNAGIRDAVELLELRLATLRPRRH